MFTKAELELISDTLGLVSSGPADLQRQAHELRSKVDDAIKDMKGGAYRGALVRSESVDTDLAWLASGDDDLGELISENIVTKANTLASMAELEGSLIQKNDALRAQIELLKPVAQIQAENERLKLELAAMGPPEAQEVIDILTRKLAGMRGERGVLTNQVTALKAGLRAERIDRMVDEDQKVAPHVDPCLPAVTRPCPHKFNYEECDICKPLLPPATGQ
jgi:hypothetical protein